MSEWLEVRIEFSDITGQSPVPLPWCRTQLAGTRTFNGLRGDRVHALATPVGANKADVY